MESATHLSQVFNLPLYLDLSALWFALIGILFVGYAALDGFDLGAGTLHLFSRNDRDRRLILNAIGPIWGAGSLSTIRIDNSATYVGYIQAWAGFRPGTIVFRKGGGGESGTRVNSGNDLGQPFGFHFQHANFVLVDGSVHPMSYATDSKVLRAMATIAGSDD